MSSAAAFDPREVLASLPRRPGVYRMYDASGELLYVGKAASLRGRVASYFSSRALAPKVAALVKRIARIEVTLVNTETEALLLECNLIKAHHPRYNILLRDDKSFPWIVCTQGHEYPRLMFWRGLKRPPGRAFGPYTGAPVVREVLQNLQKVFRIRNCRDAFFAHRTRPCLQYQIGRCSAPCVGLIDRERYAADVQAAIAVLGGEGGGVVEALQARMAAAARELRFEEAAALRDQLAGLRALQARQIAATPRGADLDVVAIAGEPGQYAICVLPIRDGQALATNHHFPGGAIGEPADTLASFLLLYYSAVPVPPRLITGIALADEAAVANALSQLAGRAVHVRHALRGLGARWVDLARENAAQALAMRGSRTELRHRALQQLAELLDLPAEPQHIECFDVSHTAGEGTVTSCVVFGPEGARKRDYRRYNIGGITAGDDFGALRQALQRHGRRIVAGERPRPDLMLIDGGAGQLHAVAAALEEVGCAGLRLLGVSKGPDRRAGEERLHRAGVAGAMSLPPDSPALHLIQRIRDEAHRFAISGHRRRRARRFRESVLEAVPGLGPARRRALLTHFGGLQGVIKAAVDDLERVPGVGAALARAIYDHLHPGA
ncbi:MAG: excinuclease ABC subunit UvrC [Gammaproteobacteria bacterium]|nr:excinuclease ABC subunit UvrC [Gammaproteobacteria bacterium]